VGNATVIFRKEDVALPYWFGSSLVRSAFQV
jgi:hypothetical protein